MTVKECSKFREDLQAQLKDERHAFRNEFTVIFAKRDEDRQREHEERQASSNKIFTKLEKQLVQQTKNDSKTDNILSKLNEHMKADKGAISKDTFKIYTRACYLAGVVLIGWLSWLTVEFISLGQEIISISEKL